MLNSVCVCVCMCMFVWVRVCAHVCMCACCACMCVCVCMCVSVCVHVMRACVCVCKLSSFSRHLKCQVFGHLFSGQFLLEVVLTQHMNVLRYIVLVSVHITLHEPLRFVASCHCSLCP